MRRRRSPIARRPLAEHREEAGGVARRPTAVGLGTLGLTAACPDGIEG